MKTFCLVNLAKHEIHRDHRGKIVLREGQQPPTDRPSGLSWEEVEMAPSRSHTGEPRYVLAQGQVGRVSKIYNPES